MAIHAKSRLASVPKPDTSPMITLLKSKNPYSDHKGPLLKPETQVLTLESPFLSVQAAIFTTEGPSSQGNEAGPELELEFDSPVWYFGLGLGFRV